MQLSDKPGKITLAFAADGDKRAIPVASQIGITDGAASMTDGYPPITRLPYGGGGIGPSGLDTNGVLYSLSSLIRWNAAGASYPYDSAFATDANVGGYPKGSMVLRSDSLGFWINKTDNNETNPETSGAKAAGWVPGPTTGLAAVTMTNANVTLTELQYGQPGVVITGLLTGSLNLIFPAIAGQKWMISNRTTGAEAIEAKTASGTGVIVPQDGFFYQVGGDGTNIIGGGAFNSSGGSVTSASVVSANGFSGSVANATTTPAITLSTGVKGLLKGDGTALSAATSGTDYAPGTAALATGILKTTTTTGALTIAGLTDLLVTPKIYVQIFTSSGTYTPHAGMLWCFGKMVGGGGGSAAVIAGENYWLPGTSGSYTEGYFTMADIGASKTVTIGAGGAANTAGGTTSFGTIMTAHGGTSDATMTGPTAGTVPTCGFGVAGNNSLNVHNTTGTVWLYGVNALIPSMLGTFGMGGAITSGGGDHAGKAGVLIIYEFCNQ